MASAAAAVVGVAIVGVAIVGVDARVADDFVDVAAGAAVRSARNNQDRVNVDRAADDAVGKTAAMAAGHFGDDSYGDLSAAVAASAAA
jgi:hypothetical protein